MGVVRLFLLRLLLVMICVLPACVATPTPLEPPPRDVSVMAWNIWHGGRKDGDEIGPTKVVELIRQSGADIVAMQETYGSGERISGDLGFHFLPRGTNVSLHSRYPIIEDISVFEPFKCVGGLVEVPGDGSSRLVAVYSIWLPYDAEIWERGTRPHGNVPAMLAACASSARDIALILNAIEQRLSGPKYAGVPIVIAGDFNSMSHLDYTASAADQYVDVIDWPTSRVMTGARFVDAYRACRPDVNRASDRTWTPRFPEQEQDRIDFVYVRGTLTPISARIIDTHPNGFPSDHAAVVTTLRFEPPPSPGLTTTVTHGTSPGPN